MRVDGILQFGEIGRTRTAFQIDDAPNVVEAGADIIFHPEKAAQVE